MTFYILDPNLTESGGHHYDWDIAIAEVAAKRDESVVIFAHGSCKPSQNGRISIMPWFSHTCYEKRSTSPYTGRFDDFRYFNDVLADELAALSTQRFTALDCVLVPTLTELHLLGYVAWMKSFDPLTAPLFVAHLMFPSGLSLSRDAPAAVVDSEQASFYGLAFQKAREPGPTIHFFGGGRQIASEFKELSGLEIEPHPIPWRPGKRLGGGPPARPSVLLYAGDAKAEKGFLLVPEVLETLAAEYPNWKFLIHANEATAWDETRKAFHRVTEMAGGIENLRLKTGRLSRVDYDELLVEADCMISTYDPEHYKRKSSGVLWESISLGLPVLAPADTWIAKEAEEWGAGMVSYQPHSAAAICEGFREFAANLGPLMKRSRSAARLFRARNGPEAVFNQFADLWAARWMAAKLAGQPTSARLALAEQTGEGLYATEAMSGGAVRWTNREFDISFAWDFSSPWELSLTAHRFIGAEQILAARAQRHDGEPLRVASSLENDIGKIVVVGAGDPAQDGGAVRIRIVLPWTYRPEGEDRDLGILIRDITVGPSRQEPMAVDDSGVRILSRVTRLPAGGFRLEPVVSGVVALAPDEDASVSLSLQTSDIAALRATSLYVNGVFVPMYITNAQQDLWRASARISRNIIVRGGYATQWDLVNPHAGSVEIVVTELALQQKTVTFRHTDEPAAAAPAENAPPAGPPEPFETVIIGSVSLDDYLPNQGDYTHLGLSLFHVRNGEESWDQIKFNLCRFKGMNYVEFRDKPDWPKAFRIWPGEHADQFSAYVKFPDPEAGGALPRLVDARDKGMIQMLFGQLPSIVQACQDPALSAADRNAWAADAAALSRKFAQSAEKPAPAELVEGQPGSPHSAPPVAETALA